MCKHIEQELLLAEKFALVGELASGLAHEIGTPLGVITGTAEYLLMETADPSSQQELAVIVSQTEWISTLMRQLLTFARPLERIVELLDLHLVNAWHAMPQGDTLTIATREEDQRLVIQEQDTSQGIAPEHRSRIFDPFFTTKDASQGTGLGLFICQQIITQHGGSITVESAVE